MATTFTGQLVHPSNYGVPHPTDMAVQLGRIPRWTGSTRRPWVVLHHLWCCWRYWTSVGAGLRLDADARAVFASCASTVPVLGLLLHDSDEVMTGDISSTWKHPAQKAMLAPLERRIWDTYAGHTGTTLEQVKLLVKPVDLLMARAECWTVAPPNALHHSGLVIDPDPPHTAAACTVIRECADTYGDPATHLWEDGALVRWYVDTLTENVGQGRMQEVLRQFEDPPVLPHDHPLNGARP